MILLHEFSQTHLSKLTGDYVFFKFIKQTGMDLKYLIPFQSKRVVFKFPQDSVVGAIDPYLITGITLCKRKWRYHKIITLSEFKNR